MKPEDELEYNLKNLSAEIALAQIMFQEHHMAQLANCLNRIERFALVASYCIFDISDMV